jgi:hypothetical protein
MMLILVKCMLDDTHYVYLFPLLEVDFVDTLRTAEVSAVAADRI